MKICSLLLLLVCVLWTVIGQPGNNVFICRVQPGQAAFSSVRGQDSTVWDIVWVSPQGHRLVSASHPFLLQIPHCPCSVRKRFSRDYCCWGRSKPGCRIVELHTRWELTTWADFQLCLHRLFISAGCKFSYSGFLDVSHRNGGLRISGWNWLTECWWGHIIEAVVNVGTVV